MTTIRPWQEAFNTSGVQGSSGGTGARPAEPRPNASILPNGFSNALSQNTPQRSDTFDGQGFGLQGPAPDTSKAPNVSFSPVIEKNPFAQATGDQRGGFNTGTANPGENPFRSMGAQQARGPWDDNSQHTIGLL